MNEMNVQEQEQFHIYEEGQQISFDEEDEKLNDILELEEDLNEINESDDEI